MLWCSQRPGVQRAGASLSDPAHVPAGPQVAADVLVSLAALLPGFEPPPVLVSGLAAALLRTGLPALPQPALVHLALACDALHDEARKDPCLAAARDQLLQALDGPALDHHAAFHILRYLAARRRPDPRLLSLAADCTARRADRWRLPRLVETLAMLTGMGAATPQRVEVRRRPVRSGTTACGDNCAVGSAALIVLQKRVMWRVMPHQMLVFALCCPIR